MHLATAHPPTAARRLHQPHGTQTSRTLVMKVDLPSERNLRAPSSKCAPPRRQQRGACHPTSHVAGERGGRRALRRAQRDERAHAGMRHAGRGGRRVEAQRVPHEGPPKPSAGRVPEQGDLRLQVPCQHKRPH